MGGGDPAMNLLLDEVENLLPSSSPSETLGGHDELATVMFLRGAILGSYGFITGDVEFVYTEDPPPPDA